MGFATADDKVTVEAIEKDLLKVVDELAGNGVKSVNGVLSADNTSAASSVVQRVSQSSNASQDPLLIAMANLSIADAPESRVAAAPSNAIRVKETPVAAKKAAAKQQISQNTIQLTPAVYRSIMNSSAPAVKSSTGKKRKARRSRYRPCYKFGYSELQRRASRFQKSITEASLKFGVSEHLIKSVITAESCFKVRARSRKNARGLMQLIPATARRFGVRRSYNPHQNIMGGTKYLRWLLDRYQGNLHKVLAGYNAGEGRVDRYGGIPPFRETREYVRRVLGVYRTLRGKRERSYNETHANALIKTRADYQRIWKQTQRRNQQVSRYRAVQTAASGVGVLRLDQRRCDKVVPPNLMTISYLKRSGRGGSTWSRYYKARSGETLADIMRKSGVHINSLRRLNGQKTQFIAGQPVLLWECKTA